MLVHSVVLLCLAVSVCVCWCLFGVCLCRLVSVYVGGRRSVLASASGAVFVVAGVCWRMLRCAGVGWYSWWQLMLVGVCLVSANANVAAGCVAGIVWVFVWVWVLVLELVFVLLLVLVKVSVPFLICCKSSAFIAYVQHMKIFKASNSSFVCWHKQYKCARNKTTRPTKTIRTCAEHMKTFNVRADVFV